MADQAQSVELTLTHASDLGSSPRQERFSILFRGPAAPAFGQGLYRMSHEVMGEFDLFLVPVGRAQDGVSYEAVFNRLVGG